MKRQTYLAMKSLEEAKRLFFSRIDPNQRSGIEKIEARDSLGRITARPVFAKRSSPSFNSAAMDGIAVRAELTYGTNERHPKILEIGQDAIWINTGDPLPDEFDSVIMIEKIHKLDDTHLEIRAPSYPWQNIRKVGEDIVATELLFPQNHMIGAYDMGALVSAGVFEVQVWKKPLVAILPTGSELVDHREIKDGMLVKKGQIIDYNSVLLGGLIRESGGIPINYDIVPDIKEKICDALERAIESDAHIIIINAGSSAGSKDFTVHVINEIGEVLVHGIAMMPGKPTILGIVRGKPVIGNPGYPVSATISFEQFVRPLIYRFQGQQPPGRHIIKVHPTRDIPSKPGVEEFLRVNIGKVGSRYVATPLGRAAGSITTLTRAEGIIRIPSLSEGIAQKDEAEAELLIRKKELLNTVVIIGSHDISIDILADEIRQKGINIRISSSNVGSLGGLIALKKGTCHMSGSHLLDTSTGQYNISYIKKYLKGVPVSLFYLVFRDQGLIIPKNNPKGIKGIEDLVRDDIRFVNRQPGSGTRVLLDYKLENTGISPESIHGYDHEEFTHMAVAVAVLSGTADCGMGIFAAAKALDLDFIPVEQEQYDLVIPDSILKTDYVQTLLETVRSENFRNRVTALGGYNPSKSGKLIAQINQKD